ncbi:DEAD/DEAH box helicase family protein [Desulfosporosinus sp. BICA1-9]|uniref:DEAD/DEAH box helicase family protein n=1 Tax=Desulfosporosinus sp. BICA1-9 TaxID=1531958 RepID=UPI00054B5663|nr:DEAD/DEAH box helicase family protein [Desulfosporosinus sp. BICA1-9]KJS50797.1 MAG: restriction endonuclease subunit R [Peptococcaceae bacterium BRH_c23]KJS89550.1 MAG: restriction endonuclease subunit R [Desulfosporosinus sp. BICA1-9]HBW36998.1 restriction endonuclease subunit R [Desulfosporosinus sp.]
MLFYLTLKKNGNVSSSPLREWDKQDFGASYLSTPLPLAVIEEIKDQVQRPKPPDLWNFGKSTNLKQEIIKRLNTICGNSLVFNWEEIDPIALPHQGLLEEETKDERGVRFNQLVLARQLSNRDLRGLARELKIQEERVTELAHRNVLQGKAQWVSSVRQQGRGWQCQRCGEEDVEEWPSLYGMAATCRSCESIGVSTSMEVLYRDQRSLMESPREVNFQPHWDLTEAQRLASQQALQFIQEASEKKALLWAACGAGKTEVCFPSAAWALKQGKSVLFAAPRQDVIYDILPRLQRDFPGYPLQMLTGTSSIKFQSGGLVLATTHQVLRFWQAFDVIFMDEMDAFPYQGSKALAWGLQHALCQGGKILYLTATPSPESLNLIKRGQMRLIQLPARHHRNPLPIPVWHQARHAIEPNEDRSNDEWTLLIRALRREGPILVFVPKISWVRSWIQAFRKSFPDWLIDGSYSSDPERAPKIKRLIQGEFDLFVSTTILERGITLSEIQVVVLGADHPIFDERALVQMAGRVGRTRECPGGGVVFISKHISPAIKTAIQWIEGQNRRAMELGLLDTGQKEGSNEGF